MGLSASSRAWSLGPGQGWGEGERDNVDCTWGAEIEKAGILNDLGELKVGTGREGEGQRDNDLELKAGARAGGQTVQQMVVEKTTSGTAQHWW